MKKKSLIALGAIIIILFAFPYLKSHFSRQDEIKLSFSKKNLVESPLPSIDLQDVGEIIGESTQGGLTQVYYQKKDLRNEEYIYGYLVIEDSYYDLGQVHYDPLLFHSSSILSETNISKDTIYKWTAFLGANYSKSNYFQIKDKIPYIIMDIDGNTFEADLDQDGQIETIASHGTAAETVLYRWVTDKQHIEYVNLNDRLNSPSVVFVNERNLFEAAVQDNKDQYINKRYRYQEGALYQVK